MGQTVVKNEMGVKKKKSVLKRIGIAILVILLLPILLSGLLFLYVNVADFQYDDPQQVLSKNVPMSFSQRNSFDAVNRTQTIQLDNADLYFLTTDVVPDLHFNESMYVSAYRIALEDKAVYLQGKAYGINVPIKLGIDAGWKDGKLLLLIRDAHLGRLSVPIPLKLISEKLDINLEYTLSVEDIPLLKKAQNFYIEDGYLKVTYPVDNSIVSEGIGAWVYLKPAAIYATEEDEMVMLVSDIQRNWTKDDYVSPKLSTFMITLQQNPDAYQELKVKMLAAAPEKYTSAYFASVEQKPDVMARFFPGITQQAVDEMRKKMHYIQNYKFITKFAYDIDEQFGNRTIIIRDGNFVNTRDNSVIDFSSLYEASPEAEEVFPDGTKFCAILCEGAESKQKIGRLRYGSGTAVQFKNGRCIVISKKDGSLYYNEISSQEYDDLVSGKTSVYIIMFEG